MEGRSMRLDAKYKLDPHVHNSRIALLVIHATRKHTELVISRDVYLFSGGDCFRNTQVLAPQEGYP